MSKFLAWLLGMEATPESLAGGRWSLELQSLPEGGWAVLALATAIGGVAGIWWLYRIEGRSLGIRRRLILAALRGLVLAGVVLMLLEAVLVITQQEFVDSHLSLLVDKSESMSLTDPYTNEDLARQTARSVELVSSEGQADVTALRQRSRIDLAARSIDKLAEPLANGRALSMYSFSSSLEPLDPGVATLAEALKPTGRVTGIGDALKNALALHRGHPLAGLLLLSDGRSNTGDDPRKIAEQAGKLGVPINVLAIGTEEPPRNARLVEIAVSPVVFVRDPAEIGVLVEAHGLQGATGIVTLEQRTEGGAWTEVRSEEITLGETGTVERVPFRFTPEQAGQYDFRARIADVGPELSDTDNEAIATVKVIRQKIRVLLIASEPSPEVQFLRNALLRDKGLEFASWLQSAGDGYEHIGHRPIRRLPATQQELNQYDVLLLVDPDLRQLDAAWPEMLTKFVGDAGGGLIYVAGELNSQKLLNASSTPSDSAGRVVDASWLSILPVVRDAGLYQSEADVRLSSLNTYSLELTKEGGADQIFRFANDSNQNREVLASLPGMYWHFPVTRAKPGATVLAHHGDPRMRNSFGRHVLMATHLYGPGRTAFLGFDSTYRWRYLHEEYFDGFWARLIDRVGRSKVLGGRYPFTLATDKSAYRVGDRVVVRAELVGSADEISGITQLRGEVEHAGEAPSPLDLEQLPESSNVLEASFVAEDAGAYMLKVLPATSGEATTELRPATLAFRVEPPQQEFDQPTLDRALLEDIASASGGQMFTLANLSDIPEAFQVKRVQRLSEYRSEVWDAPILFGGIMVCLVAEWVLRKYYRMA
ncbi:MAG TPA: vWA domain-containing protein [Pirellulales bacterium]|jgi:hypothetical protein